MSQNFWSRAQILLNVFGGILLLLIGYKVIAYAFDSSKADVAQYKCQPKDQRRNPSDSAILRPEGVVRVVNLTDNGEFVDRCELTEVLYDLGCDVQPGAYGSQRRCREESVGLPKLTLMYIHGWKHGSSIHDTDFQEFSNLISELANANQGTKNVIGVYIGWQADVRWLPGILKNLSFWDKKSVADEIARSGAVTGVVGSIAAFSNSARGRGDQFFAIGHSFGARILFSATNQSVIYETNKSHPGYARGIYRPVKAAADAVILLNPAFEAGHFSFIDGFRRGRKGSDFRSLECSEGNVEDREEEKFSPDQTPVVISISSSADYATRFAFPAGALLAFNFGERQRTTLGNYCNFITHYLRTMSGNIYKCSIDSDESLADSFESEGLCLKRKTDTDRFQSNNPFIVAETTPDIIKDHNDIWNKKFSRWLIGLIKHLENKIDRKAD